MATEYNHLFNLLPESSLRQTIQHPYPHPYPHVYSAPSADFAAPLHSHKPQPLTPPDSNHAPTPGRLAGEPAYCAGRHCCQWTVGGQACNNHYPSAADLDKHVATEHAGRHPNGRPSGDYHCHWAGCSKSESFGNKPKLTRHIHSHTGHKPHPCLFPGCGKGFVTKEQLKNHETTHTKTKEHICPECGKGFAVKTALTSHMNVHRGAKPYICDECGKGFADSSNLSKHKAIHKRIANKRHAHHHHHHKHSRTSISTHDSTPLFSPSPYSSSPAMSDFPQLPAPSIEPPGQHIQHGRPCFDRQCSSDNRIPCRSVSPCRTLPCNDQDCDPTFLDHCAIECHGPECEPCDVPDCEPCDMPHCDLPDCWEEDCMHFCNLQHDECYDPSHECNHTPPPPPLEAPLPGLSETTTPEHSFVPTENYGITFSGMDAAGYKQLHDFIHGPSNLAGDPILPGANSRRPTYLLQNDENREN